jgi:hypothetical protein
MLEGRLIQGRIEIVRAITYGLRRNNPQCARTISRVREKLPSSRGGRMAGIVAVSGRYADILGGHVRLSL